MPNSHQRIITNAVIEADLSYILFEDGGAARYVESLKKSTTIGRLILEHCSMDDSKFEIIAKALIDRGIALKVLDLDFNFLTEQSLDILSLLISKPLIS